MLYTIAVVLIILWLLGLLSSYTMGGVIHVLLVIAIVMVLLNIIRGRRALWFVKKKSIEQLNYICVFFSSYYCLRIKNNKTFEFKICNWITFSFTIFRTYNAKIQNNISSDFLDFSYSFYTSPAEILHTYPFISRRWNYYSLCR